MNKPLVTTRGPSAPRRPSFTQHHGIDREDDYAWLRADNWQAVMRDPAVLTTGYPRASGGGKRLHASGDGRYRAASRYALRRDEGTHQGRRLVAYLRPTGPSTITPAYVTGGQHPLFCRQPPWRRRRSSPDRRQRARQRPRLFPHRAVSPTAPTTNCIAYAVDTKGSEFFTVNIIDAETGATRR